MRCRDARTALVDRELGLGTPWTAAALRAHLDGCPACRGRSDVEHDLTETLLALRDDPAPPVDVTARVVGSLAGLPRPTSEEVPARQLGWAAAAAAACAALLLFGLWPMLPALAASARDLWTLAGALGHSIVSIGTAAATLLSTGLASAGRIVETLAPLARALRGLEPVAIAALASCAAVMVATIVLVVGRDLRTGTAPEKGIAS